MSILEIDLSLFSEQLPIPELDKSNTLLWTPDSGSCMAASSSATEIQTELDSSRYANFSHKDSVFCVAMHPTLPVCASGGGDDVAFLWDYQTKTRCQLSKHTDSVADISFSPDGKYLATAGLDGLVHVWDGAAKTNDVGSKKELRSELVHTLEGPEDGIEWLKWHPSSTVLVGGSQDGTCWMWNVPRGRCMQVFSGHGGYVTCGTFSNNGKKLITGSADNTLRIWNPQTASSVKIGGGKFHTQAITCMDMMAGSPLVLSGGEDGLLGITNVMTAKAVSMLRGNGTSIEALASSSQLNIAAAGTMNGSILLWDTIKGVLRSQVAAHSEAITRLVPHPTAPVLFSSSVDGKVKAWDVRSNQCLKTFCGHLEGILDLAIRADGSLLATASEDGSTSIYSVGTF